MTRALLLSALAAGTLLAGCKPTTVTAGPPVDPDAAKVAAAPPVKLPPAVQSSKTYRCKDNSLVYIDFFNDGTTAAVKSKKADAGTRLTAPAAGQPFTADGYSLSGTGDTVTLKRPGHDSQACNA